MPAKTISVLDTNKDGGVAAQLVNSATGAILKAQSIIYDLPQERLETNVYQRDGQFVIVHSYDDRQVEFLERDLIDAAIDIISSVGKAIHDRPDKPDMSVLAQFGKTRTNVNDLFKLVRDYRRVFTDLGLFKNGLVKQHYLNPIPNFTLGQEEVTVHLVCISAVCVIKQQPYVDFFRLNKDYSFRYRAGTVMTIGCHVTIQQAKELDKLKMSAAQKSKVIHLKIQIIQERKFGKDYKLLAFESNDRNYCFKFNPG